SVSGSVDEFNHRAETLLPEIARGAAERERLRGLPHDQIRTLACAGLFTWRIPQALGGPGASLRQAVSFLTDLAAADSSLCQAVRPDFSFIEGLLVPDADGERDVWIAGALAGDVFGNTGNESGAPNG